MHKIFEYLLELKVQQQQVATGKILVQKRVPVLPGDDVDSLYGRIAPKEHEAIVEGLLMLCK